MKKAKVAKKTARKRAPRKPRIDNSATQNAAPAPKIGRPSLFTPELGEAICERIADGATLTSICAEPDMPSRATVARWKREHPQFGDAYQNARVAQMEMLADECLDIAASEKDLARARVKIDARRVVLGRLTAIYVATDNDAGEQHSIAEMLMQGRKRAMEVFERIQRERQSAGLPADRETINYEMQKQLNERWEKREH